MSKPVASVVTPHRDDSSGVRLPCGGATRTAAASHEIKSAHLLQAAAAELQLGLQQQGGAGPLLQGGGVSPSMPAVAHLSLMSPMVRAHSAPEPKQSPFSGDGARQVGNSGTS